MGNCLIHLVKKIVFVGKVKIESGQDDYFCFKSDGF